MASLPLFASAILVWLPEGIEPDLQRFDVSAVQSPPSPNPEPWWLLHEAITYSVELIDNGNKRPWIKVGDKILSPDEIHQIYSTMGNLKHMSSQAART